MYSNYEIGMILHKANTIDDFLLLQIEILENVDSYLQQFTVDYFNFIGIYCTKVIPQLIEKSNSSLEKLACFHFFTTLFCDFNRFYKNGGAVYFKNSVNSIEDRLKLTVNI